MCLKNSQTVFTENGTVSASYTWMSSLSAQLGNFLNPVMLEGMPGKASSYSVPISCVLGLCEWPLPKAGSQSSSALNEESVSSVPPLVLFHF